MAKIVVIEDDVTFLALLRVHLASAGHEVLTAEDAALGLRAIITEAPDLILLDLTVPYLDGFEMIKALHDDPATNSIPVVVLTGRGDDDTFAQARKLGASQFLTKPVARDVLIRAIETQLSAPKKRGKSKKPD
ncbi:MAG TPA: response regulator [Burkholderiales bacterium]|nr:response regulator [Burkholderiales bacterium]